MMKSSLWVVIVVVAVFVGFLVGYSVSSYTGYKKVGAPAQGAPASGGAPSPGEAPGYGAPAGGSPAPEEESRAPAGGYGR